MRNRKRRIATLLFGATDSALKGANFTAMQTRKMRRYSGRSTWNGAGLGVERPTGTARRNGRVEEDRRRLRARKTSIFGIWKQAWVTCPGCHDDSNHAGVIPVGTERTIGSHKEDKRDDAVRGRSDSADSDGADPTGRRDVLDESHTYGRGYSQCAGFKLLFGLG